MSCYCTRSNMTATASHRGSVGVRVVRCMAVSARDAELLIVRGQGNVRAALHRELAGIEREIETVRVALALAERAFQICRTIMFDFHDLMPRHALGYIHPFRPVE